MAAGPAAPVVVSRIVGGTGQYTVFLGARDRHVCLAVHLLAVEVRMTALTLTTALFGPSTRSSIDWMSFSTWRS